jgi:hypothetical protein
MINPNRRRPPGRPRVKLTPEEARDSRLANQRYYANRYRANPENQQKVSAYQNEYNARPEVKEKKREYRRGYYLRRKAMAVESLINQKEVVNL